MENAQLELHFETGMLEQTIAIAKEQLKEAQERNEENKSSILEAKQEMRENTVHSIANLYSSDSFEALAELSQYTNTITDKIVDYEAVEHKIEVLEKLIKSPYFARIDFKFDDEEQYEKIYIGRSSLKKDRIGGFCVYDWRSPIASVFYRFVLGSVYYDAPAGRITGTVNLKRQYEISDGILEYFFDAEVQIVDEFLRKLLSHNTSPKMKTIVETIQKEQDIVIRDMENDLMIVQGVAGSGKTSIALHRAAYLMYQGLSSKLAADNILIISPNPLFEQYISNVLPELGEDQARSVVLEDIFKSVLPGQQLQSRSRFLGNLISSFGYREIIKSSIEFKTSPRFIEVLERFIEDMPHKQIHFSDVCYDDKRIITGKMLKDKVIAGMKDTPLGMRLKLMQDYVLDLISEWKGRISRAEKDLFKEKQLAFMELDIEAAYQALFEDRDYFYQLAGDINLPENIDEILMYTQENLESDMLQYDDAAVLTYLKFRINGVHQYQNIKHVVIDEAQDYYPLHFEIFKLLFGKAKFTILGDINQTLEKNEDLTLYDQIRTIFGRKRSSLVTMDKSFRCTNEILNFGLQFLEGDTQIKSFNRSGEKPQIFAAKDQQEFQNNIITEVKNCRKEGYQSIGLICKTEKNARFLYECIKDSIDIQLIRNENSADLQGVLIMPVYMSKGLEFDAVLICDADCENYDSEDDRKLLYIAATRALHRLNVFCLGEVSTLLS